MNLINNQNNWQFTFYKCTLPTLVTIACVTMQPCVFGEAQPSSRYAGLPYFFPACLSTRKGGHLAFCLDLVKLEPPHSVPSALQVFRAMTAPRVAVNLAVGSPNGGGKSSFTYTCNAAANIVNTRKKCATLTS